MSGFDRPWQPERTRMALPGRLVVRMASGEGPERVPHYLDVVRGLAAAPVYFDGGPVDRVLRRFSPALRVTRAFRAAQAGLDDQRWDSTEDSTGLAWTYRIEVDPHADVLPLVQELSSLAKVDRCTPHYLSVTPFSEPKSGEPASEGDAGYAHALIGAPAALRFEPGDAGLIVAIVDSGLALDHPEFRGRLRPGVDTVDMPPEQPTPGLTLLGDSSGPDRIPRDDMGHGTACASIIGARGLGVSPGVGGAARLLPARALAAARVSGRGSLTAVGSLPDIDAAVKTAVDLGARVLNLSFGTPESALRREDPQPHAEIVEYALERGCVLIAASGNEGNRVRYFPAAAEGVIAVGSVGPKGAPSTFSSRGQHVVLCAPGEKVYTATVDDGYRQNSGTSFAAPFVAGACALLLARAARYGQPLSPEDIRILLRSTAKPFAATLDSEGCGAGILDIPAALDALEQVLAARSRPRQGTAASI